MRAAMGAVLVTLAVTGCRFDEAFRDRISDRVSGSQTRVFQGEDVRRVSYFFASDMEAALQGAYCAALDRLAGCLMRSGCWTTEG
ncbi:MAG: hypothetical protein HC809_00030 [Gammaproteobacteria bacterium]|nr:hypothetical protein [Gammaproteobacteria bacterium]